MKTLLLFVFLNPTIQPALAAVNTDAIVQEVIEPNSYVVCKNNSVVRTIRVEKGDSGCEATYTKAGVDRVIGFGRNSNSCQPFLNNVRKNLEQASWKCRDVKNAKITAALKSEEE